MTKPLYYVLRNETGTRPFVVYNHRGEAVGSFATMGRAESSIRKSGGKVVPAIHFDAAHG